MSNRVEISGLSVDRALYDLVETEVTPGSGVDSASFWQAFADINQKLGPKNRDLLRRSGRNSTVTRVCEATGEAVLTPTEKSAEARYIV